MEDLQGLLEKINREGIEKAEAEAKKIVTAAQEKADALMKTALAEAERTKTAAETEAKARAERAAETIRQSARDIIIGVRDSLITLLEHLLAKDVNRVLDDEQTVVALVAEAIRDLVGPGEIRCNAKLVNALNAQAAALKTFKLVSDDTVGTGFTVSLDNGRVEHPFTTEAIAAELAKRLRPDLAKLVLGA